MSDSGERREDFPPSNAGIDHGICSNRASDKDGAGEGDATEVSTDRSRAGLRSCVVCVRSVLSARRSRFETLLPIILQKTRAYPPPMKRSRLDEHRPARCRGSEFV